MQVTRLQIANLRSVEAVELHFRSGFNLIVGVNGVGKTSVLDALAVCLSAIVKEANHLRTFARSFTDGDIRAGSGALTVECQVSIGAKKFTYLIHKPRGTTISRGNKDTFPGAKIAHTPERELFVGESPSQNGKRSRNGVPLAIFFSTKRAVPSVQRPSSGKSSGGIVAAFAEALSSRELRLGEFADWFRVQQSLSGEVASAARVLKNFNKAVTRFLPGYKNLRIDDRREPGLIIDRGATTIHVRQLSDGERGTLALVLDITRRLVQANPEMSDPAAKAEAVVLIDEIDLHLHPRWQREVVRNLTAAFPRCQFIATTHSPQVIGAVEANRIQIMADGKVYSPKHSFGVDSSRILEEVMDAAARDREMQELLQRVNDAIAHNDFAGARKQLLAVAARMELGENDPEVTRFRTLLALIGDGE